MVEKNRKTRIDIIGDVPWGTHLCQFYQTKEDLIDILVPYFKAGLENNEFCMWITSEPISERGAEEAMRKSISDFDSCIKRGQIEIVPHSKWYFKDGVFDLQRVLNDWIDKVNRALSKGYEGIRITGNTAWLEKRDWRSFTDYEEKISKAIGKYKMIAICTYFLDKCGTSEIIDVVSNHQFALIRRKGKWELIESSERKKAEESLMQAVEEWDKTFNAISDLVFILDSDFRFLKVNKAFCDVLKVKPEDLIGKRCYEILHKTDQPWHNCPLKKTLKDRRPHIEEVGDSNIGIPLLISTSPLFDDKGTVISVVHIAKDITKRKKMEEMLRISEKKFRDLTETTTDWIWEVDKDGVYTYVSPKVKDFLGYEVTEVLGKTPFDLMPKEEAEKNGKIFKDKVINKEPFYKLENVNCHKDGHPVVLETNGIPIFDEQGQLRGYRGIDRDITERKKAEEALKEFELQLREQKLALEQKNLALKEMIEHIERTKNKLKDDIMVNVNESLLPILKKLKIKGGSHKYVDLLHHHLKGLTSSFGRKITQKSIKLTPREIELCNAIKGGLTSKELSKLLNISPQTIEKHRRNIRKKLGISNKKINLPSFLQQI